MTTALSTATINITNNNLLNNSITAAGTTSAFGGIINTSIPGTLNITNNIMRDSPQFLPADSPASPIQALCEYY